MITPAIITQEFLQHTDSAENPSSIQDIKRNSLIVHISIQPILSYVLKKYK